MVEFDDEGLGKLIRYITYFQRAPCVRIVVYTPWAQAQKRCGSVIHSQSQAASASAVLGFSITKHSLAAPTDHARDKRYRYCLHGLMSAERCMGLSTIQQLPLRRLNRLFQQPAMPIHP